MSDKSAGQPIHPAAAVRVCYTIALMGELIAMLITINNGLFR